MTLNLELQNKLKKEFKPLGIVAYSNCCRPGCTGTYEEDDDFKGRDDSGINYISLFLNGINYRQHPDKAYASYDNFKYLMANWIKERKLIKRWAEIVGVEVKIKKPKSKKIAVEIIFSKPLNLEKPKRQRK
jgi:hypothetical protein